MGYTHTHQQQTRFSWLQWTCVTDVVGKIVRYCRDELSIELSVQGVGTTEIVINGIGAGECGDFVLEQEINPNGSVTYTKTNRKHYDVAVGLILVVVGELASKVMTIKSNGDWNKEDWLDVRAAYQEIFGDEPKCPWETT